MLHFYWFPAHILSVHSMCFYQIWRNVIRATRSQKGSEANLKAGMLSRILSVFIALQLKDFVNDLATSITFVVLDCFTVEFLEVGLRSAGMQPLSNSLSESFMTLIAFCVKAIL